MQPVRPESGENQELLARTDDDAEIIYGFRKYCSERLSFWPIIIGDNNK